MQTLCFILLNLFSVAIYSSAPEHINPFNNWPNYCNKANFLCDTLDAKDAYRVSLMNKGLATFIKDTKNRYIDRMKTCLSNTLIEEDLQDSEEIAFNSLLVNLAGNAFSVIVKKSNPNPREKNPLFFLRYYEFYSRTYFERLERSQEDIKNNKPIPYSWEHVDSIQRQSEKPINIFLYKCNPTICVDTDKEVGVIHVYDRVYIYNANGDLRNIEFAQRSGFKRSTHDYTKDLSIVNYDANNKQFILQDTGISIALKFLWPEAPHSFGSTPTLYLDLHSAEIWNKSKETTNKISQKKYVIKNTWARSYALGNNMDINSLYFPPKIRDILQKETPTNELVKPAATVIVREEGKKDLEKYDVNLLLNIGIYNTLSSPLWDKKATKPLKAFYQNNFLGNPILKKLHGYKLSPYETAQQLVALYYAGFDTQHPCMKKIHEIFIKNTWWPLSNGKEINVLGSIRRKKTHISGWLRLSSFVFPRNRGILEKEQYEYEKQLDYNPDTIKSIEVPELLSNLATETKYPVTDDLEKQIVQTVFNRVEDQVRKIGSDDYKLKPLQIYTPWYKKIYNSFFDTIEHAVGKIAMKFLEPFLNGI